MKKRKAVKNDLFASGSPLIYLITDGKTTDENFSERRGQILSLVKTAIETKISLIQIREKRLSARNVFRLASQIAQIAENSDTKILLSDRADIALAAKADGVHLPANSLSAEIVRRSFPTDFIIGVSTHSLEKAAQAKFDGADFATFSPIFATPDKGEPKELDALREVCEKLKPFPIIALGGIGAANYESVLQTGASGFAAIRFLNNIENLERLSRKFPAVKARREK